MKVYQKGEAQTDDEIIVEFDFMWAGQQVILVCICCTKFVTMACNLPPRARCRL